MTLHEIATSLYRLSVGGYFNHEKWTKTRLEQYLRHWFGEVDGIQRIAADARGNQIWVMEIALPDGWWHMQVVRLRNGLMSYDIPETREQEAHWFPQFFPAANA